MKKYNSFNTAIEKDKIYIIDNELTINYLYNENDYEIVYNNEMFELAIDHSISEEDNFVMVVFYGNSTIQYNVIIGRLSVDYINNSISKEKFYEATDLGRDVIEALLSFLNKDETSPVYRKYIERQQANQFNI